MTLRVCCCGKKDLQVIIALNAYWLCLLKFRINSMFYIQHNIQFSRILQARLGQMFMIPVWVTVYSDGFSLFQSFPAHYFGVGDDNSSLRACQYSWAFLSRADSNQIRPKRKIIIGLAMCHTKL